MNIELKGNLDLIRSVEEGSRLLLSEHKSSEEKVLTVLLEEAPESKSTSITKEGNSCHICFREPVQYFRIFNYVLHHSGEDFSLEERPFFENLSFFSFKRWLRGRNRPLSGLCLPKPRTGQPILCCP